MAAAHMPWVVCDNQTILAQGAPKQLFTEAILSATDRGDMLVVHQDEMILIQQKPHSHGYRDLITGPVVGG